MASASMHAAPSALRWFSTVVFPLAMPPVMAITRTGFSPFLDGSYLVSYQLAPLLTSATRGASRG